MNTGPRPAGITVLSMFFLFGTVMSGLAALMLAFPGSFLEPVWKLNPTAQNGFSAMGSWAILLMVVVCGACATASTGLWRLARAGYWTAVVVLGVNLLGDTANALVLHDWRTLIGLPIGGTMLWYLVSKRHFFQN